MVVFVVKRLVDLFEERLDRLCYSFMIMGYFVGGVVVVLLYCYMFLRIWEVWSEFNVMMDCFKRVYCVMFGLFFVSLLLLLKFNRLELKKSIFMSFVNEGDLVVCVEKLYVKSFLEFLVSFVFSVLELKKWGSDEKYKEKRR